MSFYEIGKEIESLKSRISTIEENTTRQSVSDDSDELLDSFVVELIPDEVVKILDGEEITEFDKAEVPRCFLTGGLIDGKEGWPDNRRYNKYSGTVWLQNTVGDKLNWYYIETGSHRGTRDLDYPKYASNRSAHVEVRNTHICRFGWRGKWYGGHSSAASWGRFVQQNGSGWRFKWSAG